MVNQDEVIAQLERLQKLRDAGVLTQAELDSQKAALLGQPATPTNRCAGCGAPLQVNPDWRCIYCGTPAPQSSAAPRLAGGNESLADAIFAQYPDKKIMAIKELRGKTGLGLKEAKDLIDAAEQRAAGRR